MNVMTKTAAAAVRPDLDPDLNNLAMSKEAQPLFDAVKKHIEENVAPISDEFFRLGEGRKDNWSWAPGQLELLEGAKNKAKASGLWNFFLPHSEIGRGLTNLDYAYIAAELGKQPLASESLNCSAPDTGNMEVLEKVGHARAEGEVAEAAAQRRDPLGLCHDRAGTSPRPTPRTSPPAPSSTATSG